MTTEDRPVRAATLIIGHPGTGKGTAALTSPGPILLADADHSSQWIEKRRVINIARGEEIPTDLEPTDIVAVQIDSWSDWRFVFETIMKGDHPFQSVVIDPIDKLQMQLKQKIRGPQDVGDDYEKSSYDTWDQVLHHLETDLQALMTMKNHSTKNTVNIVVTCPAGDEEPYRPNVEGQLQVKSARWFDIVGYMNVVRGVDENGKAAQSYGMQIAQGDKVLAEVKCRIPPVQRRYGTEIPHFSFDKVFDTIAKAKAKTNTDNKAKK